MSQMIQSAYGNTHATKHNAIKHRVYGPGLRAGWSQSRMVGWWPTHIGLRPCGVATRLPLGHGGASVWLDVGSGGSGCSGGSGGKQQNYNL